MGRKSRTKGHGFERQVRNILQDAWEMRLERTPMSGGWGKMKTGGDILGNDDFPLYIECRKQEGWKLDQLFKGKGVLWDWWEEVKEKSKSEERTPIVVFSRNHAPIYVMCYSLMIPFRGEVDNIPCFTSHDAIVVLLEHFVKEYHP